jgi:hypothetical protein
MRHALVVGLFLFASSLARADGAASTQPSAALPALPALSGDGATIALYVRKSEAVVDSSPANRGTSRGTDESVVLAPLGKTTGEQLPLRASSTDTPYCDLTDCAPDVVKHEVRDDHRAEIAARLAKDGYVALPAGGSTEVVDGVTMQVAGTKDDRKVAFKVGRKVLARTEIPSYAGEEVDAVGFAVVRGAQSWIYVQVHRSGGGPEAGSMHRDAPYLDSTEWIALKVTLPRR